MRNLFFFILFYFLFFMYYKQCLFFKLLSHILETGHNLWRKQTTFPCDDHPNSPVRPPTIVPLDPVRYIFCEERTLLPHNNRPVGKQCPMCSLIIEVHE